MIGRSDCNIKKILFFLLILSGLTFSLFSQDHQLSDVINVYRRVVAMGPGPKEVTLNRVDSISPGDTVLLIQMQGVEISTDQDFYGQDVFNKFGDPGAYEFLLVESVDPGTKKVVFTRFILNTFDIRGSVQLIKVPYYNSAKVTGKLTSKSWNNTEKTGGVLAVIVGRKLIIDTNAEIDVSGKGFKGGKDTIGIVECVNENYLVNNHDSYPRTWLNAGYKGEGVAIHDQFGALLAPLHMKGQGPNFTGGGGGNGKYSGGGGGSNRGLGGDGDKEKDIGPGACSFPSSGALGGTSVISSILIDGIFFGGGGGTSTHAVGSTGSSGGNGGGIVIIVADTISGNSKSIKADGTTAGNATSDAGAGGGGAGGSVILSLQSFSDVPADSLKISIKGGNGGINPLGFGNGGGGGGGLFWISTSEIQGIPAKVLVNRNYGIPGPKTSPEQGNGEIKYSFIPKLNGFLFNSITSDITGNQIDSICSNVPFGQISGTLPVGGKPDYTFQWEESTVSESTGYNAIPGANSQDYTPGLLTQTTWFRRVVTDSSVPVITDISIPVKVIVQQAITNNIVGKDTTICNGQDPLALAPLNGGPANGSSHNYYKYKWLQNLTNLTWDTLQIATGTSINAPGYDPPALTETTYYKRFVASGRCIDYSPTVAITVLPSITGNITARPDSVICEGSLFNSLGASAAGGGDLTTYIYQWQDSTASSVWIQAAGANTSVAYSPDTSTFSIIENRFIRRVVFSGPDNVCRNNSSPIKLTRYHKIKNNSILSDPAICSGSVPVVFQGSGPTQGKVGDYTYAWQDSTNGSVWTTRGANGLSFSASAPTLETWYRRIVNSSKCTNTSLSVVAYKMPTAYSGPDAVFCGPKGILNASPSVGTGTWYYPAEVLEKTVISASSVEVTVDSLFDGKNIAHKFVWEEINGICRNKDSVIITFDKRVKHIYAGPDTTIYSFDHIVHLVADPVLAWETGSWDGNGVFDDKTINTPKVSDLPLGTNTFIWKITNGACTLEDEVIVSVNDLIIPEGFSPNNDSWNNTFTVKGLDLPNQVAELTVVNGAGAEVFSTSNRPGREWTDWDGKNSKGFDLPEGTYYYLLKITSNGNGQVFKQSGFVVLKRY